MTDFETFKKKAHSTKAKRMEGDRLYALERDITARISFWLTKKIPGIRGNHVSLAIVLIVLGVLFSNFYREFGSSSWWTILQLLVLQLTPFGDKIDGEIARAQGFFTQRGIYLDRLYHFLYPGAFYFSLGYFFYLQTEQLFLLPLVFILAFLMTLSWTLGKFKQHIKYKIELESNQKKVKDFYENPKKKEETLRLERVGYYLVFMVYDWVWAFYMAMAFLAFFDPSLALYLYLLHAIISILVLLYRILVSYPKKSLFSRSDMGLE